MSSIQTGDIFERHEAGICLSSDSESRTVHAARADKLFKRLRGARLDNSYDDEMSKLHHVDLMRHHGHSEKTVPVGGEPFGDGAAMNPPLPVNTILMVVRASRLRDATATTSRT